MLLLDGQKSFAIDILRVSNLSRFTPDRFRSRSPDMRRAQESLFPFFSQGNRVLWLVFSPISGWKRFFAEPAPDWPWARGRFQDSKSVFDGPTERRRRGPVRRARLRSEGSSLFPRPWLKT